MAQIAKVVSLTGKAFVVGPDGQLRALKVGDQIQKGEVIRTAQDARVELMMADGQTVALAPESNVRMDESMVQAESRPAAQESAVQTATVEAVIQALDRGQDLNQTIDPAAAGADGGGESGGDATFVRLLRIVEGVNPLAFEYSPPSLTIINVVQTAPLIVEQQPIAIKLFAVNILNSETGEYQIRTTPAQEGQKIQYVALAVDTNGSPLAVQPAGTVDVTFINKTATNGSDYSSVNITVELGRVFSANITNDTVFEETESYVVDITNFSGAANYSTVTYSGTTTLIIDDDRPTLTIGDATIDEGSTLNFAVTLSNATEADLHVKFTAANGTAETGDYDATNKVVTYVDSSSVTHTLTADVNGNYTVPAGVLALNVAIATTSDTVYEGAETFTLSAAVQETYVTATDTGLGTIKDDGTGTDGDDTGTGSDDDRPTLTIGDATIDEGSTLNFAVTLSNATEADLHVKFTAANGTAETGDYDATNKVVTYVDSSSVTHTLTADVNGNYTVPAGVLALNVAIATTSDTVYEGAETFTLSAAVQETYVTATDTGLGTIKDDGTGTDGDDTGTGSDDDRPTLTIGDATIDEGSTLNFAVTLSNATEADLHVKFTAANGTAETGDYDATNKVVTYVDSSSVTHTLTADVNGNYTVPAGVLALNVAIATTSDTVYEGAETFTLSAAVQETYVTATDTGLGTIKDDGTGTDGDDTGTGSDDDRPTLTIGDATIDEGSTLNFAVTLSNATEADLHVKFTAANGTAETGDYDATNKVVTYVDSSSVTHTLTADVNGNYTVPAGVLALNVAIATTSDTVYEGAETFTLSAAVQETYVTATDTGLGTIKDDGTGTDGDDTGTGSDDDRPTLTIGDATIDEGSTLNFAVTLSNATEADLHVKFTAANGTAETGDYDATNKVVTYVDSSSVTHTLTADVNGNYTVPAGVLALNVAIATTSDTVYEGAETFTLSAAVQETYVTATDTGLGTIKDDGTGTDGDDTGTGSDDDRPTLTIGDATIDEGSTLNFAVTLSNATEADLHVKFTAANGTAETGDYDATNKVVTYVDSSSVTHTLTADVNGNYTVPAGVLALNVAIATTSDTVYEGAETFTLSAAVQETYVTATDTGLGTIKDDGTGTDGDDTGTGSDDDRPTLTIGDATIDEGSTLNFAVTLSNATEADLHVKFTAANGTAETGDYDATNKVVTYVDSSSVTHTLTADVNGNYTVPAGVLALNVAIATTSDTVYEGAETFTLSAAVQETYVTATDTGLGTIKDDGTGTDGDDTGTGSDDDRPTLTIGDATIDEGSTLNFAVTLSNATEADLHVKFTAANGTAETGDYDATNKVVTYVDSSSVTHTLTADVNGNYTVPAGVLALNVAIATTSDTVYEGAETFTLSAAVQETYVTATDTGLGTIKDDGTGTDGDDTGTGSDDDRPTLTIGDATIDEGSTLNFAVTLSNATEADLHVKFTAANGTAETGDYDATNKVVTYVDSSSVTHTLTADVNGNYTVPAGVLALNVAIATTSDTVYEGAETFTLSAAVQETYVTATDTGLGTIKDDGTGTDGDDTGTGSDDDRPTLTIGDATIDEGSTLNFAVTLSNATEADLHVKFTAANGTAETGDYDATNKVVTYVDSSSVTHTLTADVNGNYTVPAGVLALNVAIATTSDTVYEGAETFTLSAAVQETYVTATDTGLGTIKDDGTGTDGDDTGTGSDDDRPTLTIGDATIDEGSTLNFAVTLSNATEADLHVKFIPSDVTTSVSDYITANMVVSYTDSSSVTHTLTADTDGYYTVPAGVLALDVSLPTYNDTVPELTETLTLSADVRESYVIDADTATGTIKDFDNLIYGANLLTNTNEEDQVLMLKITSGDTVVYDELVVRNTQGMQGSLIFEQPLVLDTRREYTFTVSYISDESGQVNLRGFTLLGADLQTIVLVLNNDPSGGDDIKLESNQGSSPSTGGQQSIYDQVSYTIGYNGTSFALVTPDGTVPGDYSGYIRSNGTTGDDQINLSDNPEVAGTTGNIYFGNTGNDSITGGSKDDRLYGEVGNDTIKGAEGNDLLSGGSGTDKLFGDAGNDMLLGGEGVDELTGGSGDDYLSGGAGDDLLSGGEGSDVFAWTLADTDAVPPVDTIEEFDVSGSDNDVLDLRDLLSGEQGADDTFNLSSYITFGENGGKLVLSIDPDGAGAGGVTQKIVLNNYSGGLEAAKQALWTDLTGLATGPTSDADLLKQLIAHNNLKTDI